MTIRACTVAADVGNTATKLCVRCDDQHTDEMTLIERAVRIDGERWYLDALDWVISNALDRSVYWHIASVHDGAAEQLLGAIDRQQPQSNVRRVSHSDIPMKTLVDRPDRLGVDRLLGAFAAHRRLAGPLVVVDAGSAVTVDCVSAAGEFLGGAILPGLSLQARSLATGTDALPEIELDAGELELPAKNTAAAIQGGVLLGLGAAIDRLIEVYENAPSFSLKNGQVVITGGDADALSPQIRHPHQIVPNLVCLGLLDLASPTVGGEVD